MNLSDALFIAGLIGLLAYPPIGLVLIIAAAIASTIDTARTIKEWVKCL